MADRYWVGGPGSKSFQDTANWSTTRGGAGGAAVPVDGDAIYIIDGTSNIDSGLSNSSLDPGKLEIRFSGSIGTVGNPLVLGNITGGGDTMLLDCASCSVVNITASTTLCIILSAAPTMVLTGGTYPFVMCGTSGSVTISGSTAITVSMLRSGYLLTVGMGVIIENGAGAIDNLYVMSGTVVNYRNASPPRADIGARGTLITESGASAPALIHNHGRYIHRSADTIDAMWAWPGSRTSSSGSVIGFTLTELWKAPGSSVFETSTVPVTISATYNLGSVLL